MATLDSRFICVSDLELFMVDNSSGLPLSGGIVTFYSDVNRTTLKPVYQLTGTPGNYTYAPLNNPCTLSSAGTFQDGLGNNIVPYYYPFTGTPAQDTGVQELYYIVVQNSGFVPQFTRQGWPQSAGSGTPPISDNEIENYIPNGQFLAHNNIVSITEPPITQYTFGSQTVDAQAIAQGGWYFVCTNANMATFNNSFSQIPSSGGWGINSFPKYAFNFVCQSFDATAVTRDLRIQWPDVNKFSSGNPAGTTPYTLFFHAKSNDGNSYTFTLNLIYYFGTGGSPSSPVINPPNSTPLATFTVGPSTTFANQNIQNIVFPANQGTIGTNGDDYIALSITGPARAWNVAFTDFALVQGNEILTSFPIETNAQMLSEGVAGWMPTPNPTGSDLYLPLVLTPQGMIFDHSQVGTIVSKMVNSAVNNEIYCDGTAYSTNGYSTIGIPYSRLQAVLFNNGVTTNVPLFGTGANFSVAYINSGKAAQIVLCNNNGGAQSATADGSTMTNFTFVRASASAAGINYDGWSNSGGVVTGFYSPVSPVNAGSNAGTSGMSVSDYNNYSIAGYNYAFVVLSIAASSLANPSSSGLYFTFSTTATNYYMWFQITNETDPTPGGTGIKVILDSTMAAADVGNMIAQALTRSEVTYITCGAASTIAAGSFFTFYANSVAYNVWYQVAGVGTAPVGNSIMVKLAGTEIAAQVATETQVAINSYQFAVPDLRGIFLRGSDTGPRFDLDYARRFGEFNALTAGGKLGSYELSQFEEHIHGLAAGSFLTAVGSGGTNAETGSGTLWLGQVQTGITGGTESRPVNITVNFYIKY